MKTINLDRLHIYGRFGFLAGPRPGVIGLTFILLVICGLTTVAAQSSKKRSKIPEASKGHQTSQSIPGASSGPAKCAQANGLIESEIADLLTAHNKERAKLKLTFLAWDCKLADKAQVWAQRGIAEHDLDTDYGENLFVADVADVAAVTAVDRWMREKQYWDSSIGACAFGKVCSHYTQVVSTRTARLGCGINRNSPKKWKVLLVCNYDPPGNYPGRNY